MTESTIQALLVNDRDAAGMLGICRSTFLKMVRSGRIDIPCHKLGRRRLYSTDALKAWVSAGARPNVGRGGRQ